MPARPWLRGLVCSALGLLSIAAFFDAATLHGRYRHTRDGIRSMPMAELVFMLWYLVWGGLAVLLLSAAIHALAGARLARWYEVCVRRSAELLVILALPLFALVLMLRQGVLLEQSVADDELVYQFNARNLVLGQVTSRPPLEPEYLMNEFIIVDAHRWHGKYPLGHSLLLAPFELLGRPDLLGALLAVASMALTFALAKRFVGEGAALLAALLLMASPHFLLTHATFFSQTTTTCLTLLAAFASIRHSETQRARWLVAMGAALGLGVLARPLPMLLVLAVLMLDKLWAAHRTPSRLLRDALAWGMPLALFAGLFLLVNVAQSGHATTTGYHEVHGSLGLFENISGELTNSLGGALVRENVWLFGWPCSLLFVPLARLRQKPVLFWSVLLTALAYRALVPKVVVGTTGPLYVTEAVPWLCIASVAGMQRALTWLRKLEVPDGEARLASLTAAGFVVALCAFAPIELREIRRGAGAREHVWHALAERHAEKKALVFCDTLIPVRGGISWSFDPPNPWPDLRDDVLFLRIPKGPDGPQRMHALWQSKFSDRPAFVYEPKQERGQLRELSPAPNADEIARSPL